MNKHLKTAGIIAGAHFASFWAVLGLLSVSGFNSLAWDHSSEFQRHRTIPKSMSYCLASLVF